MGLHETKTTPLPPLTKTIKGKETMNLKENKGSTWEVSGGSITAWSGALCLIVNYFAPLRSSCCRLHVDTHMPQNDAVIFASKLSLIG